MDIEKLQQQINREAWARYRAAQAGTAGASLEKQVADVAAAFKAKHGELEHVETPSTDGPQTQQAKKLAAAISRAKAGDFVEANGVHKLAPYVFGG
jgi:hypothetical protein